MRLRGAEKRQATADEKAHRKARHRIGLTKQKSEWDRLYSKLAPTDYEDPNEAFTMGDVIAYCAGWRSGARIKFFSLLKAMWPQRNIYEDLMKESPFIALCRKAAGDVIFDA